MAGGPDGDKGRTVEPVGQAGYRGRAGPGGGQGRRPRSGGNRGVGVEVASSRGAKSADGVDVTTVVDDEKTSRIQRLCFDRLDVDPRRCHPGSRGSQPRRALGMERAGVVL